MFVPMSTVNTGNIFARRRTRRMTNKTQWPSRPSHQKRISIGVGCTGSLRWTATLEALPVWNDSKPDRVSRE